MTQKRGAVHVRPQTHLLLEKLARKHRRAKTQIMEEAIQYYETFTSEKIEKK